MEQSNNERATAMSGVAMGKSKYNVTLILLVGLLLGSVLVALTIGRYDITVAESLKVLLSRVFPIEQTWSDTVESVILKLRLPRILAATLIGGALALAGASYQSMFKNPMVSPDILGVSSGACVGASLAILAGMGKITTQLWAFAGGIIAVTLTTAMSKVMRSKSTLMLVLSGIIVSGLMNSLMGIVRFLAAGSESMALEEITFWTMGTLKKVSMADLLYVAPLIIISIVILLLFRYRLNILSLGENEARSLGVNTGKTQLVIIICSTVLTASSVCLVGTIGWVGMVVPHLGRMIVGVDNRKMLPAALIMGAVFMVLIDTLARSLTSAELPISILTGIIGAPFYFYLLLRQRRTIQ